MELIDSIKLLYCLNEDGLNEAYEILEKLSHNPKYFKIKLEHLMLNIQETIAPAQQSGERSQHIIEEVEIQELKVKYAKVFTMVDSVTEFWNHIDTIKAIEKVYKEYLPNILIFNLGFIHGKRAERAKRARNKQQETAG